MVEGADRGPWSLTANQIPVLLLSRFPSLEKQFAFSVPQFPLRKEGPLTDRVGKKDSVKCGVPWVVFKMYIPKQANKNARGPAYRI